MEDTWEIEQDDFEDFPEVVKHYSEEITKNFPDLNIRVMYVAGADHVNRCGYVNI
jgi:hypothetical protein